MRIALITNTPPPYRLPIFSRLAALPGVVFHVVFCTRREPNRAWDLPAMEFPHHFLRERFFTVGDRYVHDNPDVVPLLLRLKPEVIITDGFNPTHLYAFVVARLTGSAHVAMTDGTLRSEQTLSMTHRCVRRLVFRGTRAFIAASEGGQALFRSYGVKPEACFFSWLCVDNPRFRPNAPASPPTSAPVHDFIFCGRFEPAKDPLFALAVARETALRLRRKTRLLFVGAGSLDELLRTQASRETHHVDTRFHGFALQAELPGLYQSARVFLFPTHGDVWGVVANEACAAGLPVIVTPDAGVAGDLVLDEVNGYVRPRDITAWAACSERLLTDNALWHSCSAQSLRRATQYNFDSAAQGILDACRFALGIPIKSTMTPQPVASSEKSP